MFKDVCGESHVLFKCTVNHKVKQKEWYSFTNTNSRALIAVPEAIRHKILTGRRLA